MSDIFERGLRKALRPVAPPEGFAESVLARVGAQAQRPRSGRTRAHWLVGGAMAASVVFAIIGGRQVIEEQQEREGLEARRQLIEALRVTSEKLDLAYQAVNNRPVDDVGA